MARATPAVRRSFLVPLIVACVASSHWSTISGYEQRPRRVSPDALPALENAFRENDRAQLRGEPPPPSRGRQCRHDRSRRLPIERRDRLLSPTDPRGLWASTVILRSTRTARLNEPGVWISRVSPTALLHVVARDHARTVADLALAPYERTLEPKRLTLIAGAHFAAHTDQFALRKPPQRAGSGSISGPTPSTAATSSHMRMENNDDHTANRWRWPSLGRARQ